MAHFGIDRHRTSYLESSKTMFGRHYLEVFAFSEGLGAVRDQKGAYYIDTDGNPITDQRFIRAYPFKDGIAAIEDELGMCHIGKDLRPFYNRRFGWVSDFHEGYCAVRYRNGSYTFIDKDGNPNGNSFCYCSDFSEGLAFVLEDDGFTFIGTDGNRAIEGTFEECTLFHEGKAGVRKDNTWHLIDREGRPCSGNMDSIKEFRNGFWSATKDGHIGYIDAEGRFREFARLSDDAEINEMPAWTDDILKEDWDSCVVFMRHSERISHYRCNEEFIGLTSLTRHGDELARAIGRKIASLKDRKISGYCSKSPRCVTTANCIMGSMGVQANVAKADEIGPTASAFVHDLGAGWDYPDRADTLDCIALVKGDRMSGWNTPDKVLENMKIMLDRLLQPGTLTFCVSHDWFVIMTVAYVCGRFASNDWMDYCEGCLFVRKGDELSMIWKGKEYPFVISDDIKVDTEPESTGKKIHLDPSSPVKGWEWTPPESISWIGEASEGIYTMCDREGRFFHADDGEYRLYSRTFGYAEDFSEQSAAVYRDGIGSTYITDFGDYLHNRWFTECGKYREGLAAVKAFGSWHYIDSEGESAFKGEFTSAGEFLHGEALVFSDGKPCRISRAGIVEPL